VLERGELAVAAFVLVALVLRYLLGSA